MKSEEVIKRNLGYWIQYPKPYCIVDAPNIFQAFQLGMRMRAYEDALTLLHLSLELIEAVSSQNDWINFLTYEFENNKDFYFVSHFNVFSLILGHLYLMDDKDAKTKQMIERIQQDSPAIGEEDFSVSQTHFLKAKMAWKESNLDLALHHARSFLDSGAGAKIWEVQAHIVVTNLMGIIAFQRNDIKQSKEYFRSALINRSRQSSLDFSRTQYNLAVCHLYTQNYQESLLLLGEISTIFYKNKRIKLLARTEFARSLIYFSINQWEQAFSASERGLLLLSGESNSSLTLWGEEIQQEIYKNAPLLNSRHEIHSLLDEDQYSEVLMKP